MSIPPLVGGFLPPGRHLCGWTDVRDAFVLAPHLTSSTTRLPLWADLERGLVALNGVATIYQMWIAGSFTSDKLDPGDIDVTFVIDGLDHYNRSPAERQIIESFLLMPDPVTGALARTHGLDLDSFVIDWWPYSPELGGPAPKSLYDEYCADRGYWDDWWLRRRSGPKGSPGQVSDALPRRGFLEVNVRDFAV